MATPLALVDCNNFYASCERLFQPDLRERPVVVLSNNDGCVIAGSNEAKALGIGMGDPWHLSKAKFAEHGVIVRSSNYTLYGDLSARVMKVLRTFTPNLEVYSIDEALLSFAGFDNRLDAHAKDLRVTVLQWTGIPVSVGIGPTKTLAKVAHRTAKKQPGRGGVCNLMHTDDHVAALPGRRIVCAGADRPVGHLAVEQASRGFEVGRVAADQAMRADLPEVADPRDGWAVGKCRHNVGRVGFPPSLDKQHVDLGHFEACDRNVEVKIERRQMLQLDSEDLAIPAGLLGEFVVGKDVSALLSVAKMLKTQARHGIKPELLRGFDAAVAGDNGSGLVDEYRVIEAEGLNARCNLGNLLRTVCSRIAVIRAKFAWRAMFDFEYSHSDVSF